MKKLLVATLLIGYALVSNSQTPEGFSYQAVIRDLEGQPLIEQAVSVRLTLQNAEGTIEYYTETHSTNTSPQGVVSLAVGSGTNVSGNLSDIPWESGGVNLKVEVDPTGGATFSLLGTSPLLAVPYALYALSGNEGPQGPQGEVGPQGPEGPEGPLVVGSDGQTLRHDGTSWVASSNIHNADANVGIGTVTPTEKLEVAGNIKAQGRLIGQSVEVNQPQPEEEPIFVVRNSLGQIVFAVYESGVRVYVEDTPSANPAKVTRGGFAVGGLSDQTKVGGVEYLRITPDSVRFNINTPVQGAKATKGGFAVGGLSDQTKGTSTDLLFIAPDSARIYVKNPTSKSTKGGFAIGGLSDQTKTTPSNFLFLTPENYFIGHEAGSSITTGLFNSFIGYEAGKANTIGRNNIFMGYKAGTMNTGGNFNNFLGNYAGYSNTEGFANVFIGDSAGYENTSGFYNVFIGRETGKHNTEGDLNIFIGEQAGYSNTTGIRNLFFGTQAGWSNTEGFVNTFIGVIAGAANTTGSRNVFIGQASGYRNEEASFNVFIGDQCGAQNVSGEANVFIGRSTGWDNRTGSSNVYVGEKAGYNNREGSGNIFIGRNAGINEMGSNKLYISNSDTESPLIYGEFDTRKVEIKGSVKIKEVISLIPQSSTPGNPETGDIFYDANSNSIKYFNGSQWMELNATPSASPPIVETLEVPENDLMSDSCKVLYWIKSQGSSPITQSGIRYDITPFFDAGSGTEVIYPTTEIGELTIDVYDLTELTTYYVRSYAVNDQGTALGNMISFTTPANPEPTVSTNPVINITQTTATAGGNVIKEGDTEVTERGVCWSTSPEPTITNNIIEGGSGLGDFTCEMTELAPETSYYVRAYATNSIATSYGNEVIFTVAPLEMTVTDVDNNTYNVVQIGTQTWMKENLKTTKYRNGDEIPNITDNTEWIERTLGAYCWYDNDEVSYKDIYGAHYNFYAVSDSRNLCPEGWHVPSDEEWVTLVDYLGGQSIAGGNLKEEGTTHWAGTNSGANNSSGFTALPAGYRYDQFNFIGFYGIWWTSTPEDESYSAEFLLTYNSNTAQLTSGTKNEGASVRCIKD